MDNNTHAALIGCVSSLRSSMQLLESSINILDSGVSDYPRLSKVLQTTTHFELVSERDLTNAQSSLLSEIRPEVANLLARVETYLDRLARREQSLSARVELQEGRIARPSVAGRGGGGGGSSVAGTIGPNSDGRHTNSDAVKLQQLRAKKERLNYAVGRLELQASQRQRQLRKSMAVQP